MRVLEGHTDSVTSLAYGPDGRMLVSGGRDGAVCLWDPFVGKPLRRCKTEGTWSPVSSVAASPSGDLVAAGSIHGEARTWHTATGVPCRSYLAGAGQADASPVFVTFRADEDSEGLLTGSGPIVAEWPLDDDE